MSMHLFAGLCQKVRIATIGENDDRGQNGLRQALPVVSGRLLDVRTGTANIHFEDVQISKYRTP
jgi:hypothetical protein